MPNTTNEKTPAIKKTVRKKAGKKSSVKAAGTPAVSKATTKRTKTSRARVSPSQKAKAIVTSEERHRMIAEAAFYLAEKRGFAPGHAESDWAQAAQAIDEMIINA